MSREGTLTDIRLTESLFAAVKRYNFITWEDADTEANVRAITLRGMNWLDRIAGQTLPYHEEDTETQLLLDYVRYVRAGAFAAFPQDFQGELLALHTLGEVTAHETAEETTNTQ